MSHDDSETHRPPSEAHPLTSTEEPTARMQDANIGITLKSRYVIEKELGRGGIGVVYLAHDNQLLHKPVVIKVLLAELGDSEEHLWLKRKFRQEIEALARIDHPGVVGALDVGQMPDGKQYLVMQFVEGANLRSAMKVEGMEFGRAARIIRQIGQALNAAHDKGVYHRDLKPENIMLQTIGEGEEYAKLIDFGIATVKDSQMVTNRQTTAVMGTLGYMAPEQLMGKPVPASDIYAFGIIAYEMLTGRKPFYPESPYQLYELQKAGVRIKPVDLRQGIPESAQEVILRALSFDPKERQTRAREFGEALAQALTQSYRSNSQPETLMSPAREAMKAGGPTVRDETRTGLSKLRLVLLSIAAVVVLFIGIGIVVFLTRSEPLPPVSGPFSATFDKTINSHWIIPSSSQSTPTDDGSLSIEDTPELIRPKNLNYEDLRMDFHIKLANTAGVSWAVRVVNEKEYYLFYLSGPEGLLGEGLYFYVVRDPKSLQPEDYKASFSTSKVINLEENGQYLIVVLARGKAFDCSITPATGRDAGTERFLGRFEDGSFPFGGIGFRTMGREQFLIQDLFVTPLGTNDMPDKSKSQ